MAHLRAGRAADFVAEMDFDPAEEIKDAIRAALTAGDLGYPHKGELGEAFAEFAADRLGGWSPRPGPRSSRFPT